MTDTDNTSLIPLRKHSGSLFDPFAELRRYLVFKSPVMGQKLMFIPQMAKSAYNVLITGETGTGKEMAARAVHGLSAFSRGPFIALNCGAIPESLIEGELFGHEKGAFTGAQALHRGKFELAANGSLFLDEIGEMPLALQARLLRVLEERQFYRVGGEKPIKARARIIAATQVDLAKAVEDKMFREDLYYRLNILRAHLPPLRERTEDIPLLCEEFLSKAFRELGREKPYPSFSSDTLLVLRRQPWKGNVRELKNMMTRLAVLLPAYIKEIIPDHLSFCFPEQIILQSMEPRSESQSPDIKADAPRLASINSDSLAPETLSENQKSADVRSEKTYLDSSVLANRNHADDKVIEIESLEDREGVFIPIGLSLKDAEDLIIKATLKHTRGNRTRAAKILRIGLRTIRRKINENKSLIDADKAAPS